MRSVGLLVPVSALPDAADDAMGLATRQGRPGAAREAVDQYWDSRHDSVTNWPPYLAILWLMASAL
jgi:hypothetical protein